jgi:CheY-like chemotaxis protein
MAVSAAPDESPVTRVEVQPYGVVLLVDDEETVLDLEQEILRGNCSKVWTARNGREALDILARESVDVVVTDLKMPGEISGADIYAWVRNHNPALPTRVVFTMSDAHTEPVRGLLQESGCPWLQKPFNVDDFLRVVQQVLAETQETLHFEVT